MRVVGVITVAVIAGAVTAFTLAAFTNRPSDPEPSWSAACGQAQADLTDARLAMTAATTRFLVTERALTTARAEHRADVPAKVVARDTAQLTAEAARQRLLAAQAQACVMSCDDYPQPSSGMLPTAVGPV